MRRRADMSGHGPDETFMTAVIILSLIPFLPPPLSPSLPASLPTSDEVLRQYLRSTSVAGTLKLRDNFLVSQHLFEQTLFSFSNLQFTARPAWHSGWCPAVGHRLPV
jgi:hypothetical protein